MTVSIASELSKINKIEYLENLPNSDLAFWLIHSFTPERFRADNRDVVKFAIGLLYSRSPDKLLIAEFVNRLWGMHGTEPDHCPDIFKSNVVSFK